MHKASKRRNQAQTALGRRWSSVKISSSSDSSGEKYMMDVDDKELPFSEKLLVTDIGDIAEMCKSKCDAKYLNTLLYMSLRYFDIKWESVDQFLMDFNLMKAETSHKWATAFIKGDFEEFTSDLRGGKQTDSLYDMFPEIEADAKSFVVQFRPEESGFLQ